MFWSCSVKLKKYSSGRKTIFFLDGFFWISLSIVLLKYFEIAFCISENSLFKLMRSDKLLFIKFLIASGSICLLSLPLAAAERIKFKYGLLGFKRAIVDWELFVEKDVASDHLNFYL